MEPLEGSTIDLIHRRRVNTFYPGYTIILIVLGIIVALPLVKVDVVSTSGGMIRPCQEPVELFSSMTGIVDSTLLLDHLQVNTGDTLIWIRKTLPETRRNELSGLIQRNKLYMTDINTIISGRNCILSPHWKQSFRSHSTSGAQMKLQKNFLMEEYNAAEILHEQKVIPELEFQQARSKYLVACAQLEAHQESYRGRLQDELHRLSIQNCQYEGEMAEIFASLQNYTIQAPIDGILSQCMGIRSGSVIQPGTSLGSISPGGSMAADCYVETLDIREIQTGMPVKIRMDGKSQRSIDRLESEVSQIDPDVIILNGRPVYRVRCRLDSTEGLIPGMTFSASMLLYRTSLASLLSEKLNRQLNPTRIRAQNTGK